MKIANSRLSRLVFVLLLGVLLLLGNSSVFSGPVPLPTSPTIANPGDCCQDQAATCGNLIYRTCMNNRNVTCGSFTGCLSEYVWVCNPWGQCEVLTGRPDAKCQGFGPFWCGETDVYQLADCVTLRCTQFYGWQNGCNPRDSTNNTICNP
jgi:hypothetical protein